LIVLGVDGGASSLPAAMVYRITTCMCKVVCRAAREDAMAGKGKKSKQRKKLVKKLAKKVIKKAKKEVKEEETEVDRSDVKPPSPFSS
jgi:hypothetical protein